MMVVIAKEIQDVVFVTLEKKVDRDQSKAILEELKKTFPNKKFIWASRPPKGPGMMRVLTLDLE